MKLLEFVHTGKAAMTWNRNEVGLLWSRVWQWNELDGYYSRLEGVLANAVRYETGEAFAEAFHSERQKFFGDHFDDTTTKDE